MDKLYIGVDIGGTMTKMGIFMNLGDVLAKWEIHTDIKEDGSHILPNIAMSIRDKMTKLKGYGSIAGVGIGVPGPILEDGYLENCVNLGWGDINPAVELSELMEGIPVVAGNDANMAAMGEYWQGSGKGCKSLVFITLGTGVGSGIILNGKMLYGTKGLCGEVGHISVNPEEIEICNCGHIGCLDQVASATGIVRNAKRMMMKTSESSLLRDIQNLTAKDVVDAAAAGDMMALDVLEYCMKFLGKSISDISYIVDPKVFIIGGGVSKAGDFLLSIIRKHYEQYAQLVTGKAQIILAGLGNDAGIYGAAKAILDYCKEVNLI